MISENCLCFSHTPRTSPQKSISLFSARGWCVGNSNWERVLIITHDTYSKFAYIAAFGRAGSAGVLYIKFRCNLMSWYVFDKIWERFLLSDYAFPVVSTRLVAYGVLVWLIVSFKLFE